MVTIRDPGGFQDVHLSGGSGWAVVDQISSCFESKFRWLGDMKSSNPLSSVRIPLAKRPPKIPPKVG